MEKTLSIIIPTYNMEKYLRRCLDSLIIDDKELFDHLEVLVINDGSKDSSSAIAHEYQEKFPNVFRVIDKENGNYGSCVNRGLKEATGEYIKILDADDYFANSCFTNFLKELSTVSADVVITDYNVVDLNGGITKKWKFAFPKGELLKISDFCNVYDFKVLQMHAIAYKRSVLVENGYKQTEGISYTDQEWMFYPMSLMNDLIYYSISLYQYVLGREGQTMDENVRKRTISHMAKILYRQVEFLNNMSKNAFIFEYLKKRMFQLVGMIYPVLINNGQDLVLNEIDNRIKEINPNVFNEVGTIKLDERYWPFMFVKHWRNGDTIRLKMIMTGYNYAKKIKTLFK